jgi:Cu-processing system permease protein
MWKIFKYSFYDLMRSRWSYIYFFFYLFTTAALFYLSSDLGKAVVSLMNIVLILIPLISIIFGMMYYFNSREFVELLLAQPLKRSSIFLGQYLGLAVSLSLSFVLGLLLPFLFYGLATSPEAGNFITLLITGTFLTFIFSAIAFLIALKNENRIKGFGVAIFVWLFMAVLYDGLFLMSLLYFEEYPIEKFALGATIFNPIDLSRIMIMLKLDISALMGYTGAVFNQFFGTSQGIIISLFSLLLWATAPVLTMLHASKKKDF